MAKENTGLEFTLKNRWNKKLSFRRNKTMISWEKSTKTCVVI